NLGFEQRDRIGTALFAQGMQRQARSLSWVHGRAALQIRQREVALAVAAIGRAEQGKQCGILAQGQELPITECPTFWREVEREDTDFSNKWVSNCIFLS